jgi:MSHA pilin protein MshB
MNRLNKQKGFTIIELVVVILLLGILTATALPRFLNVENQAHDAVVDAVRGGLITSSSLFRAQWFAEGQPLYPDVVTDYDSMYAHSSGYAIGISSADIGTTSLVMEDVDACFDIYDSFLQEAGRPSIETITAAAAAIDSSDITSSESDFVAYLDTSTTATKRQCVFVYTGQYSDASLGGLPVLTYDAADGSVTLETTEL